MKSKCKTTMAVGVWIVMFSVLSSGCAHNDTQLRADIGALRQELADTQRKLADMQVRLETLDNRFLVVEQELKRIKKSGMTGSEAKIEQDISRLPVVKLKPTTSPTQPIDQQRQRHESSTKPPKVIRSVNQPIGRHGKKTAKKATEKSLFDTGIELYKNKRYNEAVRAFIQYLRRNPTGKKADDAVYYTGLCYLEDKEFALALDEFRRVLEYEGTDRIPDAMLGIGLAYSGLGDKSAARRTLSALVDKYPNTKAAQRARSLLDTLKDSR